MMNICVYFYTETTKTLQKCKVKTTNKGENKDKLDFLTHKIDGNMP